MTSINPAVHVVEDPNADMMCAFMNMKKALTQHTSHIIPPETPAVRNRAWSASWPQNEQWRCFHSAVPGSGRGCIARVVAMIRLRMWVADALLRLGSLKFRKRLRNLIPCSVLGTAMVRSGDGMDSAGGESADWNSDAHELTGGVRR
jgi:hypothetical protein